MSLYTLIQTAGSLNGNNAWYRGLDSRVPTKWSHILSVQKKEEQHILHLNKLRPPGRSYQVSPVPCKLHNIVECICTVTHKTRAIVIMADQEQIPN